MRRRWLARCAHAGFVWFLASAAGVQAMHPAGVAATPISAYLRGPHSAWLQAAYYVLAVSLVMLGACFPVPGSPRRESISGILLASAGVAVALVAYTYSPWPMPDHPDMATRAAIHKMCALVAFLGVTIVMFLETPLRWQGARRVRVMLFAILVLIVELWAAPGPRYITHDYGMLEKLAIAGLVIWLIECALSFLHSQNSP
jgi:hypothetical protein